jgi:predicted GNAT family acetyltransferase
VLDVPERRGMTADEEVPLMRLDDASPLDRVPPAAGLAIRALDSDEATLHAITAAAGFEEEDETFLRLIPPPVLRTEGTRAYIGEVDGEIVTTALGVTLNGHVGVFNVGTPPAHRRRGYAAAITARAVADGLAAGAGWAWLQSSTAGYRVYEALGFETVERWQCWVRT